MNDTESADVNTTEEDTTATDDDAGQQMSQAECSSEGPCRKRLQIEVAQSTVAEELAKNFKQL